MASWINDHMDGAQWAQFLQKAAGNDSSDTIPVSGLLKVENKEAQITYLVGTSSESSTLSLDDIIEVSKTKLEELQNNPGSAPLTQKAILAGLTQLDEKIRQIFDNSSIYGPDRSPLLFFEGDIEEMTQKYGSPAEKTPKEQLMELTTKKLTDSDLERINTITDGDLNLLFDLTRYHENLLDLARGNSTEGFKINLATLLIKNMDKLTTENRELLKNSLFDKSAGESLFEILMTKENANDIFEILMKHVTDDELNGSVFRKSQVLDFAYTERRYERIFFSERTLSNVSIQKSKIAVTTTALHFESTIKSTFSSKKGYQEWKLKVASSSTTAAAESEEGRTSRIQWDLAQDMVSQKAAQDRDRPTKIDLEFISKLHTVLSVGEEDIKNPGKFRTEYVKTSGGWQALYPPPKFVEKHMQSFVQWLNEGLEKCDNGEMNPVIFATQVYQRMVSIHPYENGNGRVSRTVMRYVLERYHLPPPVLGREVLPAVFPLKLKQIDPEALLNKVIEGLQQSKEILEPEQKI